MRVHSEEEFRQWTDALNAARTPPKPQVAKMNVFGTPLKDLLAWEKVRPIPPPTLAARSH
jgi:hypothetical protein